MRFLFSFKRRQLFDESEEVRRYEHLSWSFSDYWMFFSENLLFIRLTIPCRWLCRLHRHRTFQPIELSANHRTACFYVCARKIDGCFSHWNRTDAREKQYFWWNKLSERKTNQLHRGQRYWQKGKQKSNILLTGQRIKSCDIFIRLSTWNETKKIEKTDDEIAKQKDFMDQKKNPFDSFTIHSNQTDKHFFPFFLILCHYFLLVSNRKSSSKQLSNIKSVFSLGKSADLKWLHFLLSRNLIKVETKKRKIAKKNWIHCINIYRTWRCLSLSFKWLVVNETERQEWVVATSLMQYAQVLIVKVDEIQ